MGFNIIAHYMEMLRINRSLHHWYWEFSAPNLKPNHRLLPSKDLTFDPTQPILALLPCQVHYLHTCYRTTVVRQWQVSVCLSETPAFRALTDLSSVAKSLVIQGGALLYLGHYWMTRIEYHSCTDLLMHNIVHIRRCNVKSHWKFQGHNFTPE